MIKRGLTLFIFFAITLCGYAQKFETLLADLDSAWAHGEIPKAKTLITKILPEAEKKLAGNPEQYGSLLNTIALVYNSSGEEETALSYFEKAAGQAAKLTENPNYSLALYTYNIATVLTNIGRYAESEKYYLSSLPVLATGYGQGSVEYTRCFYNLGLVYTELGRYKEAESMNAAAVNFFKENPGQHSDDYLGAINNMGRIYQGMGNYSEAERFFVPLVNYYRQLDEKKEALAGSLNNLAELYRNMGDFEKAEPLFKESLELSKTMLKDDPLANVSALNNIALLYKATGRYAEAERSYKQAIQQYVAAGKKEHPDYANPLNNLGELYRIMGRYQDAADAFTEVIALRKKLLSEQHVNYANALNNLALVYIDIGQYQDALPLLEKCREIYKSILGEKHQYYANSLHNLASVYAMLGNYKEAEKMKLEALGIFKEALGENNMLYAQYLNSTGLLYGRMKNYTEAIRMLEKARDITKTKGGEDHFDHIDVLYNLAETYRIMQQDDKAQDHYLRALKGYLSLIRNYFPALNEKEKTDFYQLVSTRFETFNSFVAEKTFKGKASDTLACAMYDLQLATKGLLLNESIQLKNNITARKDPRLTTLYNRWMESRTLLAQQYRLSPEELQQEGIDIKATEKNTYELEKMLFSEVGAISTSAPGWRDVQKALKPNEAAIEMVRMQYYDGYRWTDTVYYAALILSNTGKPQFFLLPNGAELEDDHLPAYRDHIKKKEDDNDSYAKFWLPLKGKLAGVQKVYFSADGAYHQLNLYSLRDPKTNKYLVDELDITLLTNTAELVKKKAFPPASELHAELFGDPDYDAEQVALNNKGVSRFGIDYLPELPGTKVEVDTIGDILKAKKWKVSTHMRSDASEEMVKSVKSPSVLHIATHGYFLKNVEAYSEDTKILGIEASKAIENPLLRSGLMLAGAAVNAGDESERTKGEDGILTAYEASTLDLSRTELVVLSACETGLGEVHNGQGVYGLQRAFLVAGADALIMSLWIVDDFATQELMTAFYDEWSRNPKGSKQSAFRKAQLKLKEKYPSPYYWGAFVMVGD